jgi:hypothetical protein
VLHTGSAAAQLSLYDVGGAGPSFIIRDDNIDSSKGYTTLIFTEREYHLTLYESDHIPAGLGLANRLETCPCHLRTDS